MKFTKEDVFKQIEGYLTDNGKKDLLLSKRTINAQIDTLLPALADDETELSVFVEKVKPIFQTMWGNLKYDTTQFVKKWNEEHPSEEKTETTETKPAEVQNDPVLERIKKLEDELSRRDKEAAVGKKRSELAKTLSDKGVKDSSWINDLLSEVGISEDTDVEASADKYLKLYNRSHAQTPVNVTPNGTDSTQGNQNPFADVVAQRKNNEQATRGNITTN